MIHFLRKKSHNANCLDKGRIIVALRHAYTIRIYIALNVLKYSTLRAPPTTTPTMRPHVSYSTQALSPPRQVITIKIYNTVI